MDCPKCGSELKRFWTMRSQKLACPSCKVLLEPAPRHAPLLVVLLAMLPAQFTSLFRSYQFRPGPFVLTLLECGYLAACIAVTILWIREARRPVSVESTFRIEETEPGAAALHEIIPASAPRRAREFVQYRGG